MKLKNVLIVDKDINKARQFYHDLFGLEMILDNDGNMILTEGLVLQEEKYWIEFLGRDVCTEEWLHSIVDYDILPMLSEYWFDDPNKVQRWENILQGVFQ